MALSNIWTIEKEGAPGGVKPANEWGVSNITGNFVSLATDQLTLTIDEALYDEVAEWSYKDILIIKRSGTIYFRGVVTSTPRQGAISKEGYSYQLSGVWWWLEQTVFMQEWSSGTLPVDLEDPIVEADVFTSYAALFIKPDSTPQTLNEAITAIFSYATTEAALSSKLQLGTLPTPTVTPWPSEVKDASIAQVLRQVMRWSPDTVMVVDYTTSPPTCNFVTRSAASAYSLTQGGPGTDIVSNSIRSRDDLIPPAVCINYEFADQHNGETFRRVIQDLEPIGGNCKAPGAVNVTVQMQGSQTTTEVVSVRTSKIPDNPRHYLTDLPPGVTNGDYSSNSVGGTAWWKRHHPHLKVFTGATDLFIYVEQDAVVDPPDGPGVAFLNDPALDDADPIEPIGQGARVLRDVALEVAEHPRELRDGSLDDWMQVKARELTISAKVYYTGVAAFDTLTKEQQAYFPFFQDAALTVDGVVLTGKQYGVASMNIMGTNAVTKNYSRTTSSIPSEDAPTGIAKHYYDSIKTLHWEGSIQQVAADTQLDKVVGKKLNITSGHADWATMDAQVQKSSVDLGRGSITSTFGPPNHLSIQDLIQQLSIEKKNGFTPKTQADTATMGAVAGNDADMTVSGFVAPKADSKWFGGGGGGGCVSLKPSIISNELYISNGTVQPSLQASPDFAGGTVADATPPSLTITSTGKVYLKVPFTVTSTGSSPDIVIDTVTAGIPEFLKATTVPADVMPAVDPTAGTITHGIMHFDWATIYDTGGGVYGLIDGFECGSCQPIYCHEGGGSYILRFNKSV